MPTQHEYYLRMPNSAPLDGPTWFETFVAEFVKPLLDTGSVERFWFSRYGGGQDRSARFRYETDSPAAISGKADSLIAQLGLVVIEKGPFNIVADLGGSPRFLGTNQRQTNNRARGELVFDLLWKASCLFIDCLSHADAGRCWQLESNQDRGNNHHGVSYETFHHLICNLSCVPTSVMIGEVDGRPGEVVYDSQLYFKMRAEAAAKRGETWRAKAIFRVNY